MKKFVITRIICGAMAAVMLFAGLPSALTAKAATRAPVRAKNGMVASQHILASQIGVDIMKKGGNAIDAAIAVGIALAVVYPEAGNIGGGGFMVIRKKNGETYAIDYREMAPAAAHRDIFVDKEGNVIRGEGGSTIGYRASGVPGTLAGFDLAHKKYGSGKISWEQLVEPAREIAEKGYILTHRLATLLENYKEHLAKYPDSNRIFLNNGDYFKEGDLFKQPELAETLKRIRDEGAKEFYTGKTAQMIASDMKANNGLITMADLKNYVAKEREPIRGTYRGHEIISMPPPSSGGIVLLQVLKMLEDHDVRSLQPNSAAYYHLYAEASRRAFGDRAEYMADPDFADVPVAQLLNKDYLKERMKSFSPDKASLSSDVKFGEFEPRKEGTETTHYTVVDAEGTMVSNTYTINDLYGSRVTIKGTGILMNDEMDDFAARPGVPNLFGLVQGERNKVEGGKRPLSSMTPTIVLRKDGSVWFAVGARGGPRIISAVTQSVINVIDFEMDIQKAIDTPRIHHQWLPDQIMYERFGMSPDTMKILSSYGHKFVDRPGNIAQATAIMIDTDGTKLGAIDSRGDGDAIGY